MLQFINEFLGFSVHLIAWSLGLLLDLLVIDLLVLVDIFIFVIVIVSILLPTLFVKFLESIFVLLLINNLIIFWLFLILRFRSGVTRNLIAKSPQLIIRLADNSIIGLIILNELDAEIIIVGYQTGEHADRVFLSDALLGHAEEYIDCSVVILEGWTVDICVQLH